MYMINLNSVLREFAEGTPMGLLPGNRAKYYIDTKVYFSYCNKFIISLVEDLLNIIAYPLAYLRRGEFP